MYKRVVWFIFNFIFITVSILLGYTFFTLISLLSMAFLYDDFLESVSRFVKQQINIKTLSKEYCKFQPFTVITLGIFFEMSFGIQFFVKSIVDYRVEILNQQLIFYFLLSIGFFLIICSLRDVLKFNK